MFPIPDRENIRSYNSYSIQFFLSKKYRENLDSLWERKSYFLNTFFKKKESMAIREIIERYITNNKEKLTLCEDSFHKHENKPIPIVKVPSALKSSFNLSNKEILLNIFSNSIVSNGIHSFTTFCKLTLMGMKITNSRYGSDFIDKKWTILGNESSRIIDLMFLAHELGHCAYNHLYNSENFLDQIKSESCAHIFEYVIAKDSLSPRLFEIWVSYTEKVEELNKYLLFLELSLIDDYQSIQSLVNPIFFNRSSFLLIESFWTSHGYQLVYYFAEKLRKKTLKINS